MTTTISTERTFVADKPNRDWLIGNARLTELSGQLLGAHVAHAGLMMFWAGSWTIAEVGRYNPNIPMPSQGLTVIPHLASLGFGFDASGAIVDTDAFFAIGMMHLVASAVLGAGGLFHVLRGPQKLKDAEGAAAKFHYEWTDPRSLSFILGNHLILLGFAADAFVLKATIWGGIYDTAIAQVRLVTSPTLNPAVIFGYLLGFHQGHWTLLGMASVNSLEDIVGGHIWLSIMLIGGGIWHLLSTPKEWVQKRLYWGGEAILSYSLGGLAFMGFVSCAFVAFNTTAFPVEFYGENRVFITNIQLLLSLIALGGHLWHAYRVRSATVQSPAS